MKKMKKILAVALAVAMVLGMSVTTFAANKVPEPEDSTKVTIQHVEPGSTFEAYQIIDATYGPGDKNFTGYVWAPGTGDLAGTKVEFSQTGENAVVTGLTGDLITALAAKVEASKKQGGTPHGLTSVTPFDPVNGELTAGTWMILVTPPATSTVKVYNPMIVSVYYRVDGSGNMNDLNGGTVDASKNWELVATDAFAKSSELDFDKKLDKPTVDTEVKVGDVVPYTITSTIPSYDPTYYEEPTFAITDTIVNGLKYTAEPKVYGGAVTEPGEEQTFEEVNKDKLLAKGENADYTLVYTETTGFTVSFTKTYIERLVESTPAERKVTVKYTAVVLDSAVTKVGENEATLTFSRTPNVTDTKKDKEYVFTFALHGELFKVDDKAVKLPNAEFTLYVDDAAGTESIEWAENDTKKVSAVGDPYTTTNDGEIKFKGLDGDKTYYLKETAAPTGYTINDTVYKIEFDFTKPDKYAGEEITYKVKVTSNENPAKTGEYEVKYGQQVNGDAYGNTIFSGTPINIQNTKLSSLPSTGGIGTTIFTIGGCAIMIIAAGLYFASRRKTAK